MPFSHAIDGRVVHVAWYGAVTAEDIAALEQELPAISRSLGFAADVLHTFVGVTSADFSPTAAFASSRRMQQAAIPNPIRVAMVVVTKENEFLATIFKTLNHSPSIEMKVFFDEPSARRWLART